MRFTHRPGISLLEVLISMFVLVIGLLGVAAMFPVGQSYVFKAGQYDRSAALGQAAFNEIQVRGMLRPQLDYWLLPNGPPNGVPDLRGIPFAIDPLAFASNANLTSFPAILPADASEGPQLTRATLARAPGLPSLSQAIAEQLFMSHDELVIDLPSDRDTPAIQLLNAADTKRQFQGDYSWLFTAVPALDMGREDLYTVSVVVFHKRRLPTDSNDPQPPERMVRIVDGKLRGGWGGGDAQLTSHQPQLLDDIKSGQWCLLSAWFGEGQDRIPLFKWYRIVSVEDEVQLPPGGVPTRWVTLAGPDWAPSLKVPPGPSKTWVSLFEGAIAVYEKTMRIEGASLYSAP